MTKFPQLVPHNPYGKLPDDIGLSINSIARDIAKEFGHSDAHDLAQECWLWIGAFPRQSAKWFYLGADGKEKFSRREFSRDVKRICATYARKDKAAAVGGQVDDSIFYRSGLIERYLPYVWTSDVLAAVQDVQEGPGAKTDPSLGGDAMVTAMDVRRAYAAVVHSGGNWDKALFGKYALGMTQQEIADESGVTRQAVSRYIREAIRTMAEFLNGTEGFGKEELPGGTLGDGLGTREVISNAAASARTRMVA